MSQENVLDTHAAKPLGIFRAELKGEKLDQIVRNERGKFLAVLEACVPWLYYDLL